MTAPRSPWDLDSGRPACASLITVHHATIEATVSHVHASAEGAFGPAVFVDALTDFGPERSTTLGKQQ